MWAILLLITAFFFSGSVTGDRNIVSPTRMSLAMVKDGSSLSWKEMNGLLTLSKGSAAIQSSRRAMDGDGHVCVNG